MIPKKIRLPRSRFSERATSRISSDYFLIKIFENDLNHNRFGVVISTKVDKRSSQRNFWKRAIFNYAGRQIGSGRDLLIIVSPRIREISKSVLEQELEKVFKKIQ